MKNHYTNMVVDITARKKCNLHVFILLNLLTGIKALSEVDVIVPQAVAVGDTVTLQCHYDLEGQPLYTLKWYKGAREFYRFIPKEHPNTQVFPFPGIDVDLNKSNLHAIVLRNVQPEISGTYRCEVSTDAPNFYTNMMSASMYVLNVPQSKPQIETRNYSSDLGQVVMANCTSPYSYPPMNLTWFVNGVKVNDSYYSKIPSTFNPNEVSVRIGLKHFIDHKSYHNSGVLRLKCVASLFNLYREEVEASMEDDQPKPRPSSVLGTPNSGSVISTCYIVPPLLIHLLR
ncbi:titin-like [Agrilus planipennis]|uniref:Titin-like n=1 Tax=Agrilus planipennis TaxID=224129 RepID=A0A1W4WMX4_AGRPL|nr:titin-like [Agrilus planipennis]